MPVAAAAVTGLGRPPQGTGADRERRLRARIDGLLAQRAQKERRILALEQAVRDSALEPSERELVLEGRLKHWQRRYIETSELLRAERVKWLR